MTTQNEGGLRGHRTDFVRMTLGTDGEYDVPGNPDFEAFSDVVRTVDWTPGAGLEAQRGIGDEDPAGFFKGPEEHDMTIEYDLQRWLIDGSSDPRDASYDGIVREADGSLPNRHCVVDRETKNSVAAAETVAGTTQRDVRTYTVGWAGGIDTASLNADAGDQAVVGVSLDYAFEKVRSYQIDQPTSGESPTTLSVSGLEAGTEVTIEDEGAVNTETVTADGDTTATYSDIDAIYLNQRQDADVTVSISSGGDTLCTIPGANSYDGIEGDLGVPAVGTGSHAGTVGAAFETALASTISRGGADMAFTVNSQSLEVANNIDRQLREGSIRQRLAVGERGTTVGATLVGPTESHQQIKDALQNTSSDIVLTFTGGTVTVPNAVLMDTPSRTVEVSQSSMDLGSTFEGEGTTVA